MPAILLNTPYMQEKVKDVLVAELTNRLHVPAGIGKVSIGWFNRLSVEKLYVEDESGRALFEADYVAAGFKPLALLRGKWVFTSIRLFGFTLYLSRNTPEGELNARFVAEALGGDTSRQAAALDLQINSILIRRGNVNYDVLSEEATPGKFNPRHIGIQDLSANITLPALNGDSLNARIKKMSFRERSGFSLDRLSLSLAGNRDSLGLRDVDVKLAESHLKISRAAISFAGLGDTDDRLLNAPIRLDIAPSEIYLKELAAFVPAFGNFSDPVELSAEASGSVDRIDLKRLTVKYSEKMQFLGRMSLKGIARPDEAYLLGEVSKMYVTTEGLSGLINNFNARPVVLPEPLKRLGTVNFTGEISGFFDNLVAYGKLSSAIGSIETDLLFGSNKEKNIAAYVRGAVSSSELLISELFEPDNPFGVARFNLAVDTQRPAGGSFAGNIKAQVSEFDYRHYRYENLQLSGRFRPNGFEGVLEIDDPNGALYAQGMLRKDNQNSLVKFSANLKHFRPDNLNLYDKLESPEISVSLNADFSGNNIDNLKGSVSVDSLTIRTAPSNFFLRQLKVTALGDETDKRLAISSDVLNGEINGAYSFTTLLPDFLDTFRGYLPAALKTATQERGSKENNFSLLLTLENTRDLSQTLKLPFTLTNQGRITGHYNKRYDKFRMEVFLPRFLIGETDFESCYFACENPLDKIDLRLRLIHYNNKRNTRNSVDFRAEAKDNRIESLFDWTNDRKPRFEAKLAASALFSEEKDEKDRASGLRANIHIAESPLILNDSAWNIAEADVTIRNGKTDIRNFSVSHNQQRLRIDGLVSAHPEDTLLLELNRIELDYIFDVLNLPALRFGGTATG